MIIRTLSPDEKWINMQTVTSKEYKKRNELNFLFLEWSSRETEFQLDTPYDISYGGGQEGGVLYNYCHRPGVNTIHCR